MTVTLASSGPSVLTHSLTFLEPRELSGATMVSQEWRDCAIKAARHCAGTGMDRLRNALDLLPHLSLGIREIFQKCPRETQARAFTDSRNLGELQAACAGLNDAFRSVSPQLVPSQIRQLGYIADEASGGFDFISSALSDASVDAWNNVDHASPTLGVGLLGFGYEDY